MAPIIGPILSLVASGVKGFFGVKTAQADLIQSAMKIVGDVNTSEAAREAALATIISSEAKSGYWLAACWRPLMMVAFLSLIMARWFGYMPPDMTLDEINRIYDLVTLGMGGYIGGRTLEKIVQGINVTGLIKRYLPK